MEKKDRTIRYLLIAAVFCIVCVVYLGRLFYIQISGRENSYRTETTKKTVTVQAVRGEIYDRNGKKLVGNSYSYDVIVSRTGVAAMTARQSNRVYLELLNAIRVCGETEKHEEGYFPFSNSYPYYSWSEAILSGDTTEYYRLQKVLKRLGLKPETTAQELCDYYIREYGLRDKNNRDEYLYDEDEVDALIRLHYDMDAKGFGDNDYVFADNVSMNLMTYIGEKGSSFSGVTFQVDVTREYLYPGYASHILGTVGPIYSEEWDYYNEKGYQMNAVVGKSGCEAQFEDYLHGTDGELVLEVDSAGNVVSTTVKRAPTKGQDIYLTIDIDLQIAAEDGLAENVAYVSERASGVSTGSECSSGATVVMNPKTFEVLAIASYPTYDLTTYNRDYTNLFGDENRPLFNRALNGTYAPGSTFKLGMAALGLSEGVISPTDVIYCGGRYPSAGTVGGVGCSTYGKNHAGNVDVVDAIADSCNCFFCELGNRLGIDTMEANLKKFGFGQSTGFELGGETGVLAGPTYRGQIHGEKWQPGMTWQAAIGQSDNQASPLQLACYLSTLVNGGTRYSAHLLHSVYAFGSSEPSYIYTQTEDTVLDRIELSDQTLQTVFRGMRKVVTSSDIIGRWINDSIPVAVGGKTGTAQTGKECDNALFVCTAPYNEPEIVIATVLEEGYTGGYAALTAGRILERYYQTEK